MDPCYIYKVELFTGPFPPGLCSLAWPAPSTGEHGLGTKLFDLIRTLTQQKITVGSSGSSGGSEGSMEPPFQGEPKNVFDSDRTLKAEKQAACLKCKSNLPTLTVRELKARRQT